MQSPQENPFLRFNRFVLLRARETTCPHAIREALSERGPQVSEVHSPLVALVELCALDRAEEPRRRNGLDAEQQIALLIIEPGCLEELPVLYQAIEKYLPAVTIIPIEPTTEGLMIFEKGPAGSSISSVKTTPPQPEPRTEPGGEPPYLRYTGEPAPPVGNSENAEEPPETVDSGAGDGESPSGPNPDDPPQRTLTEEERDRLHGRFDPDSSSDGKGEE